MSGAIKTHHHELCKQKYLHELPELHKTYRKYCVPTNFTPYIFVFQAKYIAQCMEEIKVELRQDNIAVKSNAVAKLTYVSTHEVFII